MHCCSSICRSSRMGLCRGLYFPLPLCCFSLNSWFCTSNVSYFHLYPWKFSHSSFVVNRVIQEMTVLDGQLPLTVWLHKLTYYSCTILRDTELNLIPLLLLVCEFLSTYVLLINTRSNLIIVLNSMSYSHLIYFRISSMLHPCQSVKYNVFFCAFLKMPNLEDITHNRLVTTWKTFKNAIIGDSCPSILFLMGFPAFYPLTWWILMPWLPFHPWAPEDHSAMAGGWRTCILLLQMAPRHQ